MDNSYRKIQMIKGDYYGDYVRWFIGTVVNSTPPHGLEGRVKVRIHGVHSPKVSDIPEAELPWASVVIPTTENGVSGYGKTPKLSAGALVFGVFMDGETSQLPVIIGSLAKDEYPTTVQYTNKRENDFESLVEVLASDVMERGEVRTTRRRAECMKFFIDSGYTIDQAAGITGAIEYASGFETLENGIGNFNTTRKNELLSFAAQFVKAGGQADSVAKRFLVQLRFVLYELRGPKNIANGKVLKSNRIDTEKGSARVMKRYYLDDFTESGNQQVINLALIAKEETLRAE